MLSNLKVTKQKEKMKMKKTYGVWILALCTSLLVNLGSSAWAEGQLATPDSVAAAIQGLDAQASADIVVRAIQDVLASDLSDATKRGICIGITAKAVSAAGSEKAASMMAAVIKRVPSTWVPVVVGAAVVASGDNSPAVTLAMIEALEENPSLQSAARSAAAVPFVLQQAEIRAVRVTVGAAPSPAAMPFSFVQTLAGKETPPAPPSPPAPPPQKPNVKPPFFIPPAPQYPGQ